LIEQYFILCTDVPEDEVKRLAAGMASGELNPRDVKARLASEIVAMYHSPEEARNAEDEFNRMFREKGLPDDIPVKELGPSDLPVHLRTLMADEGLARSKGEARRLILQGGVRLDGKVVTDAEHEISKPGEYQSRQTAVSQDPGPDLSLQVLPPGICLGIRRSGGRTCRQGCGRI
jgi:tyrosyl-tRNA synthetase